MLARMIVLYVRALRSMYVYSRVIYSTIYLSLAAFVVAPNRGRTYATNRQTTGLVPAYHS